MRGPEQSGPLAFPEARLDRGGPESLPPGDDQPEYDEPGEDADESKAPHIAPA